MTSRRASDVRGEIEAVACGATDEVHDRAAAHRAQHDAGRDPAMDRKQARCLAGGRRETVDDRRCGEPRQHRGRDTADP
jgi:hypothetical protein